MSDRYVPLSMNIGLPELVLLVVLVALLVVTLRSVVHNGALSQQAKVLWFLVVFLLPLLGPAVYWAWGVGSTRTA